MQVRRVHGQGFSHFCALDSDVCVLQKEICPTFTQFIFGKSAKCPIAGLSGSTYGAVIEVLEPKISGKKLNL